ncbi:MAG: hypothetical protein ACUVWP_07735 [bacterium]
MKGKYNMFILIFVTFYSTVLSSPKWYIEYIDSYDYIGYYSSIAIDSHDYPHISYMDYKTYTNKLKYAYYDGHKWNVEFADTDHSGGFSSIALDSKDLPHIAHNSDSYSSLLYTYFDCKKWNKEYVDTTSEYISLALDSKDNPHISYDGNGVLKYAYFDLSKWNIEIVDNNGNVGLYTSIAIDSRDNPHISYYDKTKSSLKYAYFDGSKWNIEIVDNNGDVGTYTSIAIDSKNYPHISYRDEANSCLKYAYFDSSKWNIVSFDNENALYTSIKLDSNDNPNIAYSDGGFLKYAYFYNSKWYIEIVDSANGYTSIDIDSYNYPHISYQCGYRLKYARYGYGVCIDLTSFYAKPSGRTVVLDWTISTDEDISGFNLFRRIATPTISTLPTVGEIAQSPQSPDNDYVWTKVNTSLITGTNPYSYTDRDIAPNTRYEYKLDAVVSDKNETLGTTSVTYGNGTPSSFDITSIYPCPANDFINCVLSVPNANNVNIYIFMTLVEELYINRL